MSKKRQSYYISRRFDVSFGVEITAASFEDALEHARSMQLTDFVTLYTGTQYENVESLPGMAVSETQP